MTSSRLAAICCLFFLIGCSTRTDSNPSRTATEQMLISTAADRAADKLVANFPKGTKVFVDASNFEGTDSKYAIGSIRTALLKQGSSLINDKKNAQVIVEARAGALSTDQASTLFGIPAINIPIPLSSGSLPFPEVALYKDAEQTGVAKFALTGYDPNNGDLIAAVDPQYGFAHNDHKTVLIFFSWTDNDIYPPEYKNGFLRDVDKMSPTDSN